MLIIRKVLTVKSTELQKYFHECTLLRFLFGIFSLKNNKEMRTRYLEPRVPLVPPPGRRERLAVAVPLPLTGGAALEVEGWAGPEL